MNNVSIYNNTPDREMPADAMAIEYRGTQGPLFRLGLVTSLLTLVTLGLYRFWAKTRLRKYFWSATAPGGNPIEYTGTGLEKLIGFLIAVAFLAVYLGLFQWALGFAGLSIFSGGGDRQVALQIAASQATFVLILPFIFYAQYRARRYILSRTRWRGIRLGVEKAAWGYVWRAIGHSLLTILSLGLLLPRQTFWLEKYRIDRTWYGNAQFEQGGRWQDLYPAMKHLFIGAAIILFSTLGAFAAELWFLFLFVFVGYVWMFYGFIHYRVESFRILGNAKRLGRNIGFDTGPRPPKIFWTYVLGGLLASTCAGLVASAFGIIALGVVGNSVGLDTLFDPAGPDLDFGLAQIAGVILFAMGYLLTILLYGVFTLIFVSQPVLEHYVRQTIVLNPAELDEIVQRDRDEMVEAEGFADALDVGAAI